MIICQSCGMPMSRFEDKGTEKNGDKSEEYCRFCYLDGKLVDEGITMEQKIEKNVEIARKRGVSESAARDLANRTLPNLRRWKKYDMK
ncbi:zinc ribbon domain-containing protein [Candidatus Woesearchaeota archaeon]|nr:zinc ribbon domain-containing protein [Candidatus Woesearchaeota archaeon]